MNQQVLIIILESPRSRKYNLDKIAALSIISPRGIYE